MLTDSFICKKMVKRGFHPILTPHDLPTSQKLRSKICISKVVEQIRNVLSNHLCFLHSYWICYISNFYTCILLVMNRLSGVLFRQEGLPAF